MAAATWPMMLDAGTAVPTPNHDGLESAKPDLQSVFKKAGGATTEAQKAGQM
jgi:hypothetical protein